MANDPILTPHNQAVVGDELTTVSFNYHWRKIVADLLVPATYRSFWTGTDADIDTSVFNAIEMVRDLYDFEPTGETPMLQSSCRVVSNVVTDVRSGQTPLPLWVSGYAQDSYDTDGWLLAPGNTYLQTPVGVDGLYHISAQCRFSAVDGGSGLKQLFIRVRGNSDVALVQHFEPNASRMHTSCLIHLSQNDQIQLLAYCPAGDAGALAGQSTFLELVRVGDSPA